MVCAIERYSLINSELLRCSLKKLYLRQCSYVVSSQYEESAEHLGHLRAVVLFFLCFCMSFLGFNILQCFHLLNFSNTELQINNLFVNIALSMLFSAPFSLM